MISPFWHPARIKRVSFAIIIALLIAVPIGYFFYPEQTRSLREGDFPAFYSAAKIVQEGRGKDLYDSKLQQSIQEQYWPDSPEKGVMYFAYPPYVAVLLSPLASLPPQTSKWILALGMLLCLGGTIFFVAQSSLALRGNWILTSVLFLGCAPIYVGIFTGQNTALSMFCYAFIIWGLRQGPKGEYLAGLFLGLWLFKPQFPLILIFFLLQAGKWRILPGFIMAVLVCYGLGIKVLGYDWPLIWLKAAVWFSETDFIFNQNRMISILGFFRALGTLIGVPKYLSNIAGYGLSGVLFVWISSLFRRAGVLKKQDPGSGEIYPLVCLAGPAMLLLSPHSLFYDFGIGWISCVAFGSYALMKSGFKMWLCIGFMVLVGISTLLREVLPIQPLFCLVLVTFAFILNRGKWNKFKMGVY